MFFGSVHAATNIFTDNFNDGSIGDWDQNKGTWTDTNSFMYGGALDGATISHALVMPDANSYSISFTAFTNSSGLVGEFNFFTDQNGLGDMNGYQVVLQDGTTGIRKLTKGVISTLFSGSGISLNVTHSITVTDINSVLTLYVDSMNKGSGTDSSYTKGSKIGFSTENGASNFQFDNLTIDANVTNTIGITVLRPIDEKTLQPIAGSWSAKLSTGNTDFQDGDDASKSFVGLKGNNFFNSFLIDDQNIVDTYLPRNYDLYFNTTDSNVFILQPYLIKNADGSQVTFILYDKFTNQTLPNYLITSRASVDLNSNILVEEKVTNATGISTFAFLSGVDYNISVTDINGQNTYFPIGMGNGTFNNTLNLYSIYISNSNNDINFTVPDWNINIDPKTDILVRQGKQYFDVNVSTNYAEFIGIRFYDGNSTIPIIDSNASVEDLNFSVLLDTNTIGSDFLEIRVQIRNNNRDDYFVQTYKLVSGQSSLGPDIAGVSSSLGTWGGVILTLCIIILTLQQFGPNLFGNNESQLFLVGLIMIACGILFFANNFLPILVALTFGVIVYLNTRT